MIRDKEWESNELFTTEDWEKLNQDVKRSGSIDKLVSTVNEKRRELFLKMILGSTTTEDGEP